MSRVKEILKVALKLLGIKEPVTVRIRPLKSSIARTSLTNRTITLDPSIESLSDHELLYLFVHELAHIKIGCRYHSPVFLKVLQSVYGQDEIKVLEENIIKSFLKWKDKRCAFMTYWLCITTEENWRVIREKNIWGVPQRHKNTIAKVKPGDKCLIYVMSTKKNKEVIPPRIVAAYEIISEVFEDRSRIFKSLPGRNEVFPYRVKLNPIKIFEKPIDFRSLIQELTFIKNKRKWTGHIQGKAMREIPKEDYELILSKA